MWSRGYLSEQNHQNIHNNKCNTWQYMWDVNIKYPCGQGQCSFKAITKGSLAKHKRAVHEGQYICEMWIFWIKKYSYLPRVIEWSDKMRTVLPGYAVSGGLVGGCAPDMSWMLVTNCRKTRWPRWYVSVSAHGLNPQYNYFMQNINPETWTRIGGLYPATLHFGKAELQKKTEK